jgi:hypothetical protein
MTKQIYTNQVEGKEEHWNNNSLNNSIILERIKEAYYFAFHEYSVK